MGPGDFGPGSSEGAPFRGLDWRATGGGRLGGHGGWAHGCMAAIHERGLGLHRIPWP